MQKLTDHRLFRQRCYVNGEWTEAGNGRTVPVTNPVDGEVIGSIPDCGEAETRTALQAAEALPIFTAPRQYLLIRELSHRRFAPSVSDGSSPKSRR